MRQVGDMTGREDRSERENDLEMEMANYARNGDMKRPNPSTFSRVREGDMPFHGGLAT